MSDHCPLGCLLYVMLYPPNRFECPSVRQRFVSRFLSSFLPIFFKLCMDIDIGEECFGIANGQNLFLNNRVMSLDVFFLNILRTNG